MTTESDRELLELAAKAAGLDVRWYANDCLQVADKCNGFAGKWNPLTDDGDALRLAVTLNRTDIGALIMNYTSGAEYRADKYAATRRSIVRAAAAIARATHKEQT